MNEPRLFEPLRLEPSGVALSSRTWVPAMVTWRGDETGFVTQSHIDWYGRLAQGQPGALVVEATGVGEVPSGPLLRISDDSYIANLRVLAAKTKAASGGKTRVLLQLIHFLRIRRRPEPKRFFAEYLSIAARHMLAVNVAEKGPEAEFEARRRLAQLASNQWPAVLNASELEALQFGERERITDVHIPHIANLPATLPGSFAAAAHRALVAGFDGVELHFAHAYTMAALLSPTNTRADGYGGSVTERLRLPLEVFRAVKAKVPSPFLVGCRFLADECIPAGFGPDEAATFGVAFAREGFDFLSLSRGGKFEDAKQPAIGRARYPYTGNSGTECIAPQWLARRGRGPAQGRNLLAAKAVRTAVRTAGFATPVVVSGGLHTLDDAERALHEGQADLVGSARQALADPMWLAKLRDGRSHEIRQCTLSNYCEGLDQMHKVVTCKLWDRRPLSATDVRDAQDGRALLPPIE